jgi:ATP-dependent RNA helicase DeaD
MKQSERMRVMTKFKQEKIDILVATDVAARGIDVNNIEAVFNYDIPSDEEYYVHRIGRTARAGKKGASYSFVYGGAMHKLRQIQQYTKTPILPMQPPQIADIEEIKIQAAVQSVVTMLEAGGYSKYDKVIEKTLSQAEEATALDVASALFKMTFDELERSYEKTDFSDLKGKHFGNAKGKNFGNPKRKDFSYRDKKAFGGKADRKQSKKRHSAE